MTELLTAAAAEARSGFDSDMDNLMEWTWADRYSRAARELVRGCNTIAG